MHDFNLLIGGRPEPGDGADGVVNPATGAVFAEAPLASHAQLDRAVTAAQAAFPAWRAAGYAARGRALAAAADIAQAHAGELAHLVTLEQGKPLRDAADEVSAMVTALRVFAGIEVETETRRDHRGRGVEIHRHPLGVAGVILPWNYPLLLLASRAPAALMAGNTVVLKPAPTTPLATLRFAELTRDAFPPGVLNVITGGADMGAALTRHSGLRAISFTGSAATGRAVMQNALPTLARVTLEMGGNDAGIVLPDADPGAIARAIIDGAFDNAGQVCIALKRLYVHDDIHDRLCDALAALADGIRVGDGMDPATQMGPLQNRAQYDKARALIAETRAQAMAMNAGGPLPARGYFVRPVIVRDIADDARLVTGEQFAPFLPVLRYRDIDDAIARANATAYGLGASLWTPDHDRARALAGRLDAGTVWINRHSGLSPCIPFAGAKQSGTGVEMGVEGVLGFTQIQAVNEPG